MRQAALQKAKQADLEKAQQKYEQITSKIVESEQRHKEYLRQMEKSLKKQGRVLSDKLDAIDQRNRAQEEERAQLAKL